MRPAIVFDKTKDPIDYTPARLFITLTVTDSDYYPLPVEDTTMKTDFYAEFDNLFIEHDISNNEIDITNVQMVDPTDPKNTDKWVDITDLCPQGVLDTLIGQIEQQYTYQHEMRQAAIEDAAEARMEIRREEMQMLNAQRGVKL